MRTVKSGDWVKIHYVCSLENGQLVDSSNGFPPVEFQVRDVPGESQFDHALIGMTINEEKEFTLLPEENFGLPIEGKTQEIPVSKISTEVEPAVGTVMLLSFMCGSKLPATVTEVKEESIIVDFNHPLAGKTLTYRVRVLEINDYQTGTFSCSSAGSALFRKGQEDHGVTSGPGSGQEDDGS